MISIHLWPVVCLLRLISDVLPAVLRLIHSAVCIFLIGCVICDKLCVIEMNVVNIKEIRSAELKRTNCLMSD